MGQVTLTLPAESGIADQTRELSEEVQAYLQKQGFGTIDTRVDLSVVITADDSEFDQILEIVKQAKPGLNKHFGNVRIESSRTTRFEVTFYFRNLLPEMITNPKYDIKRFIAKFSGVSVDSATIGRRTKTLPPKVTFMLSIAPGSSQTLQSLVEAISAHLATRYSKEIEITSAVT